MLIYLASYLKGHLLMSLQFEMALKSE